MGRWFEIAIPLRRQAQSSRVTPAVEFSFGGGQGRSGGKSLVRYYRRGMTRLMFGLSRAAGTGLFYLGLACSQPIGGGSLPTIGRSVGGCQLTESVNRKVRYRHKSTHACSLSDGQRGQGHHHAQPDRARSGTSTGPEHTQARPPRTRTPDDKGEEHHQPRQRRRVPRSHHVNVAFRPEPMFSVSISAVLERAEQSQMPVQGSRTPVPAAPGR